MIIGVILNNFKCFKGLHYIPLTNACGTNFCGLIGLNGVGKSTVLEALDCVFNGKDMIRTEGIKQEYNTYIIPICAVDESELQYINDLVSLQTNRINAKEMIIMLSNILKAKIYTETSALVDDNFGKVLNDIKIHCNSTLLIDKYIFPLTIPNANMLFNTLNIHNDKYITAFLDIYLNSYLYVYIPNHIASKDFAIFETEQMLRLLGLDSTINDFLDPSNLLSIDEKFKEIAVKLTQSLSDYNIKRIEPGFPDLIKKEKELRNFIISHIFPKYRLERIVGDAGIPLLQSSSGEKKEAIMDLIYHITKEKAQKKVVVSGRKRQQKRNLIIAIDEPESSFHISERFEQFNKLYEISQKGCQVLFTSHWFGFIPAIPDGCVVNIVRNGDKFTFSPINIVKYKEDISRLNTPVDISLKGNLDLIQTIASSVLLDDCYNWLICEGMSDKIYLEEYLKKEVNDIKLRIIPVGGCSVVKKLYNLLALSLSEMENDVKGKIFLLVDTDVKSINEYKKKELPKGTKKLQLKRLVNINKARKTILTDFEVDTTKYDKEIEKNTTKRDKEIEKLTNPTDVEGVLNGKVFNIVFNQFKDELPFEITADEKPEDVPSAFVFEESKNKQLNAFFTSTNKVLFARAYVTEIQKGGYKVPFWIEEIRKFFAK